MYTNRPPFSGIGVRGIGQPQTGLIGETYEHFKLSTLDDVRYFLNQACPNEIQNAVYLMYLANKDLEGDGQYFQRFVQDGENNGTATGQWCVWWNTIMHYMKNITDYNLGQTVIGKAKEGRYELRSK